MPRKSKPEGPVLISDVSIQKSKTSTPLYGIRCIYNGVASPMCVLAQAELSGETGAGLSSTKYLEVTAAITLTTNRKALFVTGDLNFLVELLLVGEALDFEEYFQLKSSGSWETYEIYNVITNEKVEVDLDDPALAEAKANIEYRRNARETNTF